MDMDFVAQRRRVNRQGRILAIRQYVEALEAGEYDSAAFEQSGESMCLDWMTGLTSQNRTIESESLRWRSTKASIELWEKPMTIHEEWKWLHARSRCL